MRFADVVKCAANLVMPMGWKCTADFSALNYPICSFSFSLLSKICDSRPSEMFSPWNRCDVLSFKQRSHRSLRNAPIRGFAIPEVWLPTKGFLKRPEIISELQREAYGLARQSVHTCMAILQAYGALGLPMCHIFQVSGSSLPVPIFIGRWIDHINLQAEVTKSGMK